MNYDFKISLIIPVYNQEKHLSQCLESIISQTLKEIEIIIIDDGSTDKSREIAAKYAVKDDRINIYFKDNSGVSSARNLGLQKAKGKYIQFVDSDDIIQHNMCKRLLETIEKNQSDLIICGYKYDVPFDQTLSKNITADNGAYTKQEFDNKFYIFLSNLLFQSPVNKLYTSDIIFSKNLRFDCDFTIGEDLLFNLAYIDQCKKIDIIEDCLYNYNHNNFDSLANKFREDYFEIQDLLFDKIRDYLIRNDVYQNNEIDVEKYYLTIIGSCFEMLLHRRNNLQRNEKMKKIIHIIKQDKVRNSFKKYSIYSSIQVKIINRAIQLKDVHAIYLYYLIKFFIKKRCQPVFKILKSL